LNKKVVLITGHFNVLHPGHIRLFKFAREIGARLIVAVESDRIAKSAAYVPENLRLEGIVSNALVDEAFIADCPVESVINKLKPDFVVKGKEHELKFNAEQAAVDKYGGRLIFSSGEAFFSSVDILKREYQGNQDININLPTEYLKRHELTFSELNNKVKEFQGLRTLVVGDLIVDEYITCEALGMSQEEPTIVVTPLGTERYIGGAGIVAAHAAGLGASVNFITVTGDDSIKIFAEDELSKYGVRTLIIVDDTRPTTLKQRYRSKGKSLLRVNHLHQSDISSHIQGLILQEIEDKIDSLDLIVLSDFNYGCLPQNLVDKIISMASNSSVYIAADSQSSSQVGDISRFKGVDLITPTEHEARVSTRDRESGLVVLADRLKKISNAKNILLKLGEEGLLIHSDLTEGENSWLTDKIEALNNSPRDVAGAGDSLLIVSAMTLARGGNIWEAAFLGSLAASIQVSREGNRPLDFQNLSSFLKS